MILDLFQTNIFFKRGTGQIQAVDSFIQTS